MAHHGKKYRTAKEKIATQVPYDLQTGLNMVKELAFAKFDESIDAHVNVSIDPTKGDQVVRGSVLLPHLVGKQPRVIVFAKGEYIDQATAAGADFVGAEDLIEKIQSGWLDFDYAVATPDMMGAVGKLAKLLGPRGLLPNKKVGTVTFEVGSVVGDLKRGRQFFKNDKNAIIHFRFGKVSFDKQQLHDNLVAFLKALMSAKPPASKGKFLKKVTVTSTMGVGVPVNSDEFSKL